MLGPALSELTAKGVAKRIGLTRGRYGKPGRVKLLVRRDQLIPVPNRTSRKANADAKVHLREKTDCATPALTIDTLEEFVRAYRREQEQLIAERSRTIASQISQLQQHLAVAKGNDFRNTMLMASAALRQLDDVEHEVNAEVIARLKPVPQSPLFSVWSAMRSGSRA
jgi:hypothetical protein